MLDKTGLSYMIVGAAALVIYGLPRSTLDIDIYVSADENTLDKLFQIADRLGLQSKQRDILKIKHSPRLYAEQWICFSYRGQDVLDVFLASDKQFKKLYKNSQLMRDKNLSVKVASLDDIMIMKKASGRPIDLADIELIKEVKKYRKIRKL